LLFKSGEGGRKEGSITIKYLILFFQCSRGENMNRNRKLLLLINRALYIGAAAMLIAGLVLTAVPQSVKAATGSVWTTDQGCSTQDKNSYSVGDQIWVEWSGLKKGIYGYTIKKVNTPNQGHVIASNTSLAVNGDDCIFVHTLTASDPAGTYKFEFFDWAYIHSKKWIC